MNLAQEMYELTGKAKQQIQEEKERQIRDFPKSQMYIDVINHIKRAALNGENKTSISVPKEFEYVCMIALEYDGFLVTPNRRNGDLMVRWSHITK